MNGFVKFVRQNSSFLILVLTPLLLSPMVIVVDEQYPKYSKEMRTAYGIAIMAVFWVTEATDLAVTSLLPLLIFPFLGVIEASKVCMQYMKDTNILLLGGLLIAVAIEQWNVHKRVALAVLLFVGAQPRRLMLGFMMTTAFISMWITNTATTAMMTPIMEAVLKQLDKQYGMLNDNEHTKENGGEVADEEKREVGSNGLPDGCIVNESSYSDDLELERLRSTSSSVRTVSSPTTPEDKLKKKKEQRHRLLCKAMLLCICYSANIGGTGTLTGTAPQLVLAGQMKKFKHLCFCFRGSKRNKTKGQAMYTVMKQQYAALGPISYAEVTVLISFMFLVLLWFFRAPKFIPGWGSMFEKGFITDGTAAMIIGFLLFQLPTQIPDFLNFFGIRKDPTLPPKILNWQETQKKFPWNVLFLLGAGFALAKACEESGLSLLLSCKLTALKSIPQVAIAFIICTMLTFLTEITSNTATATILLPVLGSLATSIEVHPLYLMIPATVCASFAFMLPVATPPNAIVFATGRITVLDMAKAGFGMNIIGILVVTLAINTWGKAYYGLDTFPAWAAVGNTTDRCAKYNGVTGNTTVL